MPGRFRQAQPTWSGTIRMLEEDYAVFCLGRGGKVQRLPLPQKRVLNRFRYNDTMTQCLKCYSTARYV